MWVTLSDTPRSLAHRQPQAPVLLLRPGPLSPRLLGPGHAPPQRGLLQLKGHFGCRGKRRTDIVQINLFFCKINALPSKNQREKSKVKFIKQTQRYLPLSPEKTSFWSHPD